MRVSRTLSLYRGLVAGVVGVLACVGTGPALAATSPDTLVVGKAADPQTLDPAVTIDNNDWTVVFPAYQRLMQYRQEKGRGSTEVEGDLARSWKVSDDNLVWTFVLKDDQRFADGSPVDARAVKLSFERLLDKGAGPSEAFPPDMAVEAVDAHTVRFTLKNPFAPFLSTLANDGAAIVNPQAMARPDADTWLAGHTAGSGPYQLATWTRGSSLVMSRNSHYAGSKKPELTKFVVRIVPDASRRRQQLQKGDLDIAADLPVDQLKELEKDPSVRVGKYPSFRVTYLYLNNARGALKSASLRRAIVDAIDYKGIVDGIMMGQVTQTRGPVPEGLWGYDTGLPLPARNISRSKAEVAKAGGVEEPLLLRYSIRRPAWEPIALTIQANLAAVGIPVKLEKMTNATLRDHLDQGNFDISIGDWGPDFADPYMFTNYWFQSDKGGLAGNRSFYSNPRMDQWLAEAAASSDQDRRMALYKQVQKQAIKDAVYVYLYQDNYLVGLQKDIKGFVYNPMLDDVFNVADIRKQ